MLKEIAESIWQIKGEGTGPSVLVLGGIHGNERTGIVVVEKLRDAFVLGDLRLNGGTLTLVLGNLPAIAANVRCIDGRDMNRMFSPIRVAAAAQDTWEDVRVQQIASLIANADITIDLHATNKPSIPFLACLTSEKHERVYRWFDAPFILLDPNFVLAGEPVTTDEYAESHGKIGVCYETGFAQDTSRVTVVRASIEHVLQDLGMLPGAPPLPHPAPEKFEMREAIILTEQGFHFTDGLGTHSFQPVEAGQTIGFHGSTPVVASTNSVLVFPKLPEHYGLGKPVAYIAKRLG